MLVQMMMMIRSLLYINLFKTQSLRLSEKALNFVNGTVTSTI